MISDAELLKLVMDRYPEQPSTFIIEQFSAFKAGLIQANIKLAAMGLEESRGDAVAAKSSEQDPTADAQAPKKKFTKRNLVVKPEDAITANSVQCCLCGKIVQNLTEKHLMAHGITVEEYKKLCGYAPEQKLISPQLLEKLHKNVQKAQRSREQKLTREHLK